MKSAWFACAASVALVAAVPVAEAGIVAVGSEVDSFGGIFYSDDTTPNGALSGLAGSDFPGFGLAAGTASVSAFTDGGVSIGATAGAGEGWIITSQFYFTVSDSATIRLRGELFERVWFAFLDLSSLTGGSIVSLSTVGAFDLTETLGPGSYAVTYISDGTGSFDPGDLFSFTVASSAIPLPGAAAFAGLALAALPRGGRRRASSR